MKTETLRSAMRAATADLDAPSDLAGKVRSGGRRRLHRRRVGMVAALSVAALLTGLVVTVGPFADVDVAGDERLNQPTAGELAGDQGFLHNATKAWQEGIGSSPNAGRGIFEDLRGEPHVYWAGTTPAGPTAVVMQRAFLPDRVSVDFDHRMQTLVGLIAPDPQDGQLKLVGDQYQADGSPQAGSFRFGEDDRTVLILDRHLPLYYSLGPREDADGRITREWQRLTVADGVAVTQAPAGGDVDAIRVLARPTPPANNADHDGLLWLERSSSYLNAVDKQRRGEPIAAARFPNEDHRLQWLDPAAQDIRVGQPRTTSFDIRNTFNAAVEDAGYLDLGSSNRATSTWWVIAGLSDGRTALVGEIQDGERDSRLYAVLLTPNGVVVGVQPGGGIEPISALPVALRLPEEQGWVLAAYGAQISYRTSANGGWQVGGTNAALVPDGTTHALVNRPGSVPVVLPLTR